MCGDICRENMQRESSDWDSTGTKVMLRDLEIVNYTVIDHLVTKLKNTMLLN